MSRRQSRLDAGGEVGHLDVEPEAVSGMGLPEARRAASEMGGVAIKIPTIKALEARGLSFKGKGINVGRGILILCADASIEVEAIARTKLAETDDPEMWAKIAGVHTQVVGQLLKNAELQMTPIKNEEEPIKTPEIKPLEPMP